MLGLGLFYWTFFNAFGFCFLHAMAMESVKGSQCLHQLLKVIVHVCMCAVFSFARISTRKNLPKETMKPRASIQRTSAQFWKFTRQKLQMFIQLRSNIFKTIFTDITSFLGKAIRRIKNVSSDKKKIKDNSKLTQVLWNNSVLLSIKN